VKGKNLLDNPGSTFGGPLTAWLLGSNGRLALEIPERRMGKYHLGLLVPVAASLNTVLVALAVAWYAPAWPFLLWAAAELTIGAGRMGMQLYGRHAVRRRRRPPVELSLTLTLLSSASVGFGAFICLSSQDWAISSVACLSAVATVAGTCLRYYPMPRLVALMIAFGLGPCVLAAMLSAEPLLLIIVLQVPLYAVIMATSAMHVNKSMVRALTAEQENDRRAHHDVLTGLLNRAGLARELNRRTAKGETFALLYLDLDRFKSVNDSFGHQAGDELLKSVADRLRDSCRSADAIARIGGDEFVILTATRHASAAETIGGLVIAAISDEGYFFSKEAAFVGASIGIAMCPEHGRELGPLLGEADAALYQAKYSGRGRCIVARTGIQPGPVDDRRPVPLAVARDRVAQSKAA